MTPGDYIRKHRQAAAMSLRDLAKRLNVSHVFLGELERGRKPVPPTMVDRLVEQVPGIKASTLRRCIADAIPFKLEAVDDDNRPLVLAFARKAKDGFSPDEKAKLLEILFSGDDDDHDDDHEGNDE